MRRCGCFLHPQKQERAAPKRRNKMPVKNLQKTFFFSSVIFCQNLLRRPVKDAIVVQTPCHDRTKRALALNAEQCVILPEQGDLTGKKGCSLPVLVVGQYRLPRALTGLGGDESALEIDSLQA